MTKNDTIDKQATETRAIGVALTKIVRDMVRQGEEYKKAPDTRKLSMEIGAVITVLLEMQKDSYTSPGDTIAFAKNLKCALENTIENIADNAAHAASCMLVGITEATKVDGSVVYFGEARKEQVAEPQTTH